VAAAVAHLILVLEVMAVLGVLDLLELQGLELRAYLQRLILEQAVVAVAAGEIQVAPQVTVEQAELEVLGFYT
jgi:hypothetical protein